MRRTIPKSELTLAILAGGTGRRLGGAAKGLLTLDGVPWVERLLALAPLCAEALIVSADPAYDRFAARRIEDVEPGRGAPGGVVSALVSARTPFVLMVACDMPFVTLESARALIAAAGETDVCCFCRDGQVEPLLAIYRCSQGPAWQARLGSNPGLRELIAGHPVTALEAHDPRVLDSINTPDQLARLTQR